MLGLVAGRHNLAMDFSADQKLVMESARGFCQGRATTEMSRALLDSPLGYDPSVWQELVELGWAGITIPEDQGGADLGIECLVPIMDMLGQNVAAFPLVSSALVAHVLRRAGSPEQQARWLPALAEGAVATIAILDSADWGATRTSHRLSADGMLAGEKWLVGDAQAAALFLVLTSKDGSPCFVLVERDQLPEGAIRAHRLIDETRRAAKVDFSGVRVAADAVLAGVDGATLTEEVKLLGALLVSAEAVGAATSCLKLTVDYLNTRKQFGKLIGSYQALKHPCVDILIKLEGARSQVYHAATLLAGHSGPMSADQEIACRMAKVCATEALTLAGDRAVQFHGGMGFTYDCDTSLYIRRAQWVQQMFGDAAHHRKRLAPLLIDA